MDFEKANAYAGDYLTKLAVDKAMDEYRAERQAQEEAEWNAKPAFEKMEIMASNAYDTASDIASSAADTIGTVATGVGKTVENVVDSIHQLGNGWENLHERTAALQKAMQTGDIAQIDAGVNDLQQAGQEFTNDAKGVILAPSKEMVRSFVNNYADRSGSPFQGTAQNIQQSDTYLKFHMTTEERLQKCREIQNVTNIPAEITSVDDKAFKAALEVYNFKQREEDIDKVWEEFPEVKNIADMDPEGAAIVLHNIEDVRKTHGIVESFTHFLNAGSIRKQHDELQFKIATGKYTDDDVARLKELKSQLENDKKKAPSFWDDPAAAMAAGVAESLPAMGEDMAVGAVLAALATVATGGTAALGAALVGGGARAVAMQTVRSQATKTVAKNMMKIGMFGNMGARIQGGDIAELMEYKDKDGKPLFTLQEARQATALQAAVESGIETAADIFSLGTVGKFIKPKTHLAQVVKDIEAQTIAKEARKNTVAELAGGSAKTWLKLTGAEVAEEGAQSVSNDLFTNAALDSKGEQASHIQRYSAADIAGRSIASMVEAIPAAAGFGIVGAGTGMVGRAGVNVRNARREARMAQQYGENAVHTMNGTIMVEQLQQAVASGKLKETAPDVQQKILREQLAGTGYEMAHIDVEMALQKESGVEDLKKVAKAAGMTSEELDTAISQQAYLNVPVEVLAQVESSPELLDTVTFKDNAESMARMRTNQKELTEAYNEAVKRTIDNRQQLIDNIINQVLPENATKEQKEMLETAIMMNPDNPAQGYAELRKAAKSEWEALLAAPIKAMKEGARKGRLLDIQDEQGNIKTIHTPGENATWYSNFYSMFGHEPTKKEYEDMAVALLTGDPSAPDVQGWTIDSLEAQQGMEQNKANIERIRGNLKSLQEIKAAAESLTGVEMQLTEGLSPEGFKMYRQLSDWLRNVGGATARQARMGAILAARHADIYAAKVTERTGKKYTAEDYMRDKIGFSVRRADAGLNQLAGVNAINAPQEALERAKAMEAVAAYSDDIYKETGWIKGQDGKWRFEIPDNLDNVNWDVFKKGNTENKSRLLKSVYKNQKLYEAYPWLENIIVELKPMDGNTYGGVAKNNNGSYIVIKEDVGDEQKSGTLIHEIQHLIQDEEGFAVGGTDENANEQIIDRIRELSKRIQSYDYGAEYADTVMDQQEMILEGVENPEAEEILKSQITELEKKIPAKERDEIWQLASDRQYLREALNENTGNDNSLYRNLAGEQEARHATDRAIIHTNADRAEKELEEKKAKYEAEKAKQSPAMKKMLDELEVLREKEKKTDAEYDRIDEIRAAMDDKLMQAETFYSWAKDTLEMRRREAAETPRPHDENAIVVFGGQEMAMTMRPDIDLNQEVKVFNLDEMNNELIDKTNDEIIDYINKMDSSPIKTSDFVAMVGIPRDKGFASRVGVKHIVSGKQARRSENQTPRNVVLSNFQEVIKNAAVIEITPNNKKIPVDPSLSKTQKRAIRRKNKVAKYYRLLIPVIAGGNLQTLAIVTEEWEDNVNLVPAETTLYEIFYAEKNPARALTAPPKREYSVPNRVPVKLSIRDMLTGVKDSEGKYYLEESENPGDILFQSAWHGSPYDFETFDLGAIGTGEGNQVHGWGLYFAQDRETSEKNYKEKLTANGRGHNYVYLDRKGEKLTDSDFYANYLDGYKFFNGEKEALREQVKSYVRSERKQKEFYDRMTALFNSALDTIKDNPKISISAFQKTVPESEKSRFDAQVQTAKAKAKAEGRRTKITDVAAVITETRDLWVSRGKKQQAVIDKWERLDNEDFSVKENTGTLFKVEIPDDDVLLDEQKSFSEQPEKVQRALRTLMSESETAKKHSAWAEQIYESKGKKIYQIIAGIAEGDAPQGTNLNNIQKLGSLLLNKYGVKGITYEGGRDGRCFVIFDDEAIGVIEKYNQQVRQQQIKGVTTLDENGKRTVHILETADESTFMHEMAHVFLFDLQELAQIDDVSAKELEIVNEWANWQKGAAAEYKSTPWAGEFAKLEQEIIDAEAHGDFNTAEKKKRQWRQERFARGFELYLKDGQAPAKGLKAVFRKFKQFLRQIYAAFVSDGGKPTLPVKRVMDRMIASEQEIEAAELEDRYADVEKAGGAKLFDENEEDTYNRWYQEAEAEAKEKLLKIVMKDLEKEKQAQYDAEIEKVTADKRKELQQEPVYLAEQAVLASGDENMALEWFPSLEVFRNELASTPPLEEALKEYMEKYSTDLDSRLIEAHMSPEAVEKAMKTSKYRVKMEALKGKAMAKKLGLINKINSKAEMAMASIEEKLTALPEDTDLKVDSDSAGVKSIMAEINKLKFSAKWNKDELNHIESMIRAATQDEMRKAIADLRESKALDKEKEREILQANEGRQKIFRDIARQAMQEKKISDSCNVNYYVQQEKKMARRVRDMIRAKRWDMAMQAQEQQGMYTAMAEIAEQNHEERNRLLSQVQRELAARTVRLPKNERYWHRKLAYILRINKTEPMPPEQGYVELSALLKNMEDSLDILEHSLDSVLSIANQGEKFRGYKDLTMDEFKEAVDSLHVIYTVGRDKFKMKTVSGKSLLDVVDESIHEEKTVASNIEVDTRKVNPDKGGLAYSELIGNTGDKGHLIAKRGQDYIASSVKPENILKMIGSTAHRYIYGTLEKAAENEAKMQAKNIETLRDIMSVYTHKERQDWSKKIYDLSTEKGDKISKEQIMCMALNWGTLSNRQRLLGGLASDERTPEAVGRMTEEVMRLFQETMTAKDWQVIQKLWDHISSYWEDTVKVEEKLNGTTLEKVHATPFTITSADGQEMNMRGGYMPIKYDAEKSSRAEENETNELVQSLRAGVQRLGAGRSYTKSRTEFDMWDPLKLEFSVVESHLQDVIHNATYRLPVRDVYRIITNKQFEEYVVNHLGREYHNILKDWALDSWKQFNPNTNTADNFISWGLGKLRGNSTMAIMGYRVWAAIENISNLPIAASKIGTGQMMAALCDFYPGLIDNMKSIKQKSLFMRNRLDNLDRDIRSQAGIFHADNKLFEFARDHAYDFLVYTDLMVSAPLWMRAYKKAYEPMVQKVKEENEANIAYLLKCQAEVDSIRAEIADLRGEAKAMDEHLKERRYASPETAEMLRQSPFSMHTDNDLRAISGENLKKAKAKEKDLWAAEVKFQEAQEIKILSDDEILDEAENRAVFEADGAVRDTFGSGRTIDLPAVQRSKNEITKLLTTFYGFFNTQFNAVYMSYVNSKYLPAENAITKWAPFAKQIVFRFVFPALIGSCLQYGLGLAGGSDDEKKRKVKNAEGKTEEIDIPSYERFMKVFAKNVISTGTGSMYLVRDVVNAVSDFVINDKTYGINSGSVAGRGASEVGKMFVLLSQKGQKDAEIQAKQEKKEREHQEKLAKLKGKKRQEYLKKYEENKQYEKPPKRTTYAEIAGHGLKGLSSFTAAQTGITSTMVNAVTSTMQYMFDTDMRYEPTWKNIIWSALFDKKPVEREIPKKPPTEPKKGKKKKKSSDGK